MHSLSFSTSIFTGAAFRVPRELPTCFSPVLSGGSSDLRALLETGGAGDPDGPPQDRAFVGNIVEATRAMTGRARTGRYPIVGSRGVIAVGSDGRMNTLAEARQDRWRGP